jgi:nitroreductase
MDALECLLHRNSAPQLTEPAPRGEDLQRILKAGLRAPDHARLKPWRFVLIDGQGRAQLGELFAQVALADNPTLDATALEKLRLKPQRAPLIIVVVACVQEHPKVPEIEQLLSAGCAAHGVLLAAHALGFAGIWRTGAMTFHPGVQRALGLGANEKIVGFLYMGTRAGIAKPLPDYDTCDFVEYWG